MRWIGRALRAASSLRRRPARRSAKSTYRCRQTGFRHKERTLRPPRPADRKPIGAIVRGESLEEQSVASSFALATKFALDENKKGTQAIDTGFPAAVEMS